MITNPEFDLSAVLQTENLSLSTKGIAVKTLFSSVSFVSQTRLCIYRIAYA